MFYGGFSCADDVYSEFDKTRGNEIIIFAVYDCEDYEGWARVVFVEKGKFYEVSGSHCSCYGLEEQWLPEEMPSVALKHMLIEGTCYGHHDAELLELLTEFEEKGMLEWEPKKLEFYLTLKYM